MKNRGFTLIEVLISVAVVAILAAIIMASLTSARKKGQDAAIRRSVLEMKKILELEYLNTGSYSNLYTGGGWVPYYGSCSTITASGNPTFLGTFATNATAICNDIVKNSQANSWADVRLNITVGSVANSYSITAWLPSKQTFLCSGSNNQMSETTTVGQGQGGVWTAAGCPGQTPWQ